MQGSEIDRQQTLIKKVRRHRAKGASSLLALLFIPLLLALLLLTPSDVRSRVADNAYWKASRSNRIHAAEELPPLGSNPIAEEASPATGRAIEIRGELAQSIDLLVPPLFGGPEWNINIAISHSRHIYQILPQLPGRHHWIGYEEAPLPDSRLRFARGLQSGGELVPEPGVVGLIYGGGLLLLARRRR